MRFQLLTALIVASVHGRFLSDDYEQLLQTAKDTPEFTLDTSKPIVMNGMYNKGGLGLQHKQVKREDEGNGGSAGNYFSGSLPSMETANQKLDEFRKEIDKIAGSFNGRTKREETSFGSLSSQPQGWNQLGSTVNKFKNEFDKVTTNLGGKTKREDASPGTTNPSFESGLNVERITESLKEFKKKMEELTSGGRTKREGSTSEGGAAGLSQIAERFEEWRKGWDKLAGSIGSSVNNNGGADKTKREDNPDYSTVITSAIDRDRAMEIFDELKKKIESMTRGEQANRSKRQDGQDEDMDTVMEILKKDVENFIKEIEQEMMQEGEKKAQV